MSMITRGTIVEAFLKDHPNVLFTATELQRHTGIPKKFVRRASKLTGVTIGHRGRTFYYQYDAA